MNGLYIKMQSRIVEQRKENYATESNLVFHETHLIDDLFHNGTLSKIGVGRDTNINHN